MKRPLVENTPDGRCELSSPTAMPRASGFLFNSKMMMQVNCRGYVTAQHMQPEPAKYARPPTLEATVFMQPEQPYFAHHPGRFFYVKDEENGELWSAPHEPVRAQADRFCFSVGRDDIRWRLAKSGVELRIAVSLPPGDTVELWTLEVMNTGREARKLSVYPFFTIGYMSWMNQSALYEPELGGIVARSISGYQKLEQWEQVKTFKDCTCLLHDTVPDAWEASSEAFEGEGGLHAPDGVQAERLQGGDAVYEMPAAVLQYRLQLAPGERRRFRFLFGPARGESEIRRLRREYLEPGTFSAAREGYARYAQEGEGCITISTPEPEFDTFVNSWLPRQVFYHGNTNRLCTDPQTRNYLQDALGMSYVQPGIARAAILKTLSQQEESGALPEGVRLFEGAELKYINQVPHTDHDAWLPVCLQAYLDETGDHALLNETVAGESVFQRSDRAMAHLAENLDERGLSLLAQGDWCDPLNMAGHKGKGVSGWLTIATVHALRCWASICSDAGVQERADHWQEKAAETEAAIQQHLWDGQWFARGITDDGRVFGGHADAEGSLFLNPQSWALMAGIATDAQQASMIVAVRERLDTPWGVQMLDPPYTHMHEDIGRLTQKFPGYAENGSIYNHAAAFWAHALFSAGCGNAAFKVLRRMIPGPAEEDLLRRGQLPVFVPNYYRGAVRLHPRTAGRSSQLFNTGTAGWFYRIVIEQLFGLKGCVDGLRIEPQLPGEWETAEAIRQFRGATFRVHYSRGPASLQVDGVSRDEWIIRDIQARLTYDVNVVAERLK
jgi:cellobionic acid phosphorylase